jgi:hypothetical protein
MNTYLHNPDKAASHLRKLTYNGAVRKYDFTIREFMYICVYDNLITSRT